MQLPVPELTTLSHDALKRPFIQYQILEAFQIANSSRLYTTPNLARWFRKNRKLGSRDRKVVSEIIYILIRYQNLFLSCGFEDPKTQLQALENQVTLTTKGQLQKRLATHLSIPQWIVEEWYSQLKEETITLGHFLQGRAPIDIRINAAKTNRGYILQELAKANLPCIKIPQTKYGLRLQGRGQLLTLSTYKSGLFEIQDAASQIFCENLNVQPGEQILDLCAGAGGKSLAMAAQGAIVYATEPRTNALTEFRKRAKKANLRINYNAPKHKVDTVIVDAPCSGSGRLRREPAIRWRWQEQDILQHTSLQQDLLQQATQYVSSTGRIVYSTCSLLRQENEHQLNGWNKTRTTYLWPHKWNCDGFAWTTYQR
jgi:16S rRNA (cytosine967-C5)-methyltransferase